MNIQGSLNVAIEILNREIHPETVVVLHTDTKYSLIIDAIYGLKYIVITIFL